MVEAVVVGGGAVVVAAEVVDATVLAGTSVVVGGTVVVETATVVVTTEAVAAGSVVSTVPLHAEATSNAAPTTAYFFTTRVCHPTPEGVVGRQRTPRCRYVQEGQRPTVRHTISAWSPREQ